MGAEQSGDAEHKQSDLNSTGECDILYDFIFFITVEEYQISN